MLALKDGHLGFLEFHVKESLFKIEPAVSPLAQRRSLCIDQLKPQRTVVTSSRAVC
jgi:hypothetical protein